jgi:SAM-dependent methyltransferase
MELTEELFTRNAEYERFMGRWSRQLSPLHHGFAALKDGDRVLDVGTGTGALALELEATMPSSEIVGVDPSEAFIEFARRAARSQRARFEVGDGQALHFPDATFDRTVSQLVMNFIPQPERAIAEMRRVTRPGGTVSACVWDYGQGMGMLRVFWDEVVALEPSLEVKDERHMKLSREGELAELWRRAGLIDVVEVPLEFRQSFVSFADFWEPFLAGVGPAGAQVAALTPDHRRALEARLRQRLLGGGADGPFTLQARAWCVRGQVSKGR